MYIQIDHKAIEYTTISKSFMETVTNSGSKFIAFIDYSNHIISQTIKSSFCPCPSEKI